MRQKTRLKKLEPIVKKHWEKQWNDFADEIDFDYLESNRWLNDEAVKHHVKEQTVELSEAKETQWINDTWQSLGLDAGVWENWGERFGSACEHTYPDWDEPNLGVSPWALPEPPLSDLTGVLREAKCWPITEDCLSYVRASIVLDLVFAHAVNEWRSKQHELR